MPFQKLLSSSSMSFQDYPSRNQDNFILIYILTNFILFVKCYGSICKFFNLIEELYQPPVLVTKDGPRSLYIFIKQ
jgi:hypothetical protein